VRAIRWIGPLRKGWRGCALIRLSDARRLNRRPSDSPPQDLSGAHRAQRSADLRTHACTSPRPTDSALKCSNIASEELRKRIYLSILFDFEVPATRDITETISLLARMARFVVADITDANSTRGPTSGSGA
jgi:hypothetical protein